MLKCFLILTHPLSRMLKQIPKIKLYIVNALTRRGTALQLEQQPQKGTKFVIRNSSELWGLCLEPQGPTTAIQRGLQKINKQNRMGIFLSLTTENSLKCVI